MEMKYALNLKSSIGMKCQYHDSFPTQSQIPPTTATATTTTTTTTFKSFHSDSAAFVARKTPIIIHLHRSSKVEFWAIKSKSGDKHHQKIPPPPTADIIIRADGDEDEEWKKKNKKQNRKRMNRGIITGAAAMVVAGVIMMGEEKAAWGLGPEGPLVEEFWENVRRYGLYALTVSTGVLYAVLQPIVELLKNPVSAVLIILIFGGSFFLLSQILSAMFGVSDFAYQYAS